MSGVTTDQRGFPLDSPPDIGAFQTQAVLVVNTTTDAVNVPAGDLSLRQAINLANALDSTETITFDPTVFATPQTITLTQGQLELSDTGGTETIMGPAAGVTISGGGMSRVFQVDSGATAVLSALNIVGGLTTGNGGGIYDDGGTVTLIDCTISGNSADAGGGVFATKRGTIGLTGSAISDDTATNGGGGLYDYYATITLTDCTVSGNSAADGGGAFATKRGTIGMTGCTISGNTATNNGGGLYDAGGSITLTDSTFSGNSAATGGGVFATKRGTIGMTGCTISGNSAGAGGGIYNAATANLYACTIGANYAATGGGIDNAAGGGAALEDTIVATNTGTGGSPSDIGGANSAGVVGANDLVGTGGSGGIAGGAGDIVLSNLNVPLLAPLGSYGGPTATMPLLPGSPAIGAGSAISGVTTDQRGFPLDTIPDIGAFQSQTALVVNTTSDGASSASGELSLRQAVNLANALGSAETITFDPTVFASARTITLTQGQIELTDTGGTETITGPAVGVTVSGNLTSRVFDVAKGVTASISGLTITYGSENYGAGLYNSGATTLVNCLITGNSALNSGGGVWNNGTLTLTDSTVYSNLAAVNGGGLANYGTMTLSSTVVNGNNASGYGGGMVIGGRTTLSDCTVSDNGAADGGGGISTGGISGTGPTTLDNCTVSTNTSGGSGGGINSFETTTTLTDCTVSDNSANSGGGLNNYGSGGSLTLTDCTVSANYAYNNGGGLDNSATALLINTIVAGNTAGTDSASDIYGTASASYSLIGTGGSGGITGGNDGNIVLTSLASLGLAPLGNYGGPNETMALLPGSAAIGAGTAASGVTTDQRGAPRSASGAVDIGAFQNQGYTITVSGGSPQTTLVGQVFTLPLGAELTENFADVLLGGALINFSAPSTGASATFSSSSVVTNANGIAIVSASANDVAGIYDVTASATGVASTASFDLTNQAQASFAVLAGQTFTYGTTATITGTLTAGPQAPAGEQVAITLDGVTHDTTIASEGSFSTQFTAADVVLNASSSAYDVTYSYATDGVFLAANGSNELTVNPAPLTIKAVSDTKVYDGTTTSLQTPLVGTLYNGDTVTGLMQAFSSKNVAGTGDSTLVVTGYTINDGNDGRDYTVTLQDAYGTIKPAALVITATSDTKVYDGTTTSSKTPIVGTLYGSDTVTESTQAFTSKNALGTGGSTLVVTGYTINDGDSGKDYTVTTETATGTITRALLTVQANNVSTVYGFGLPALTYTISGFVNGDSPASLAPPPVLHTAASSSSPPGTYAITVAGASSPNYTITYVPATLTVLLAPATVENVSIERIKLNKHKTAQEIVVQFSEALNSADAQSLSAYSLATISQKKKQKSKPVPLSSASYNPTTFTVTLLTKKTLVLSPPLALSIKATSLLDALGRELDGNDSGEPGANFTAELSKSGTTVTSARELARMNRVSAHAVDAALEAGLQTRR